MMKELQNSDKKTSSVNLVPLPPIVTTAIVPLKPQKESFINQWQHLAAQAQHINQLAAELETALLEFKVIASTLNGQRRFLQPKGEHSVNVCKYSTVGVPRVRQESQETFVLTMRKVDLFAAEREAALLAQTLRRHNQRQRKTNEDTKHLLGIATVNKS